MCKLANMPTGKLQDANVFQWFVVKFTVMQMCKCFLCFGYKKSNILK